MLPITGSSLQQQHRRYPSRLIEQLAEGGTLVVPVGGRDIQDLITLHKQGRSFRRESHGGVRFVPLIGTTWMGE